MNWESDDNVAETALSTESLTVSKVLSKVITYVEYIFDKRIYVNIFVLLLSAGLIYGYISGIKTENYWSDTFKTAAKNTGDKFKILGISIADKSEKKMDNSLKLVYINHKSLIHKKSFHSFPNVKIRSKESINKTFSKKSFNKIADSKKLRLGELKWKLLSKVQ